MSANQSIVAQIEAWAGKPLPPEIKSQFEWQKIETAPKDGTRFLGYQPSFGISIVHRHDPGGEARNPKHHYECWVLDNDYGHSCKPMKWLCLPAPPSEDKI
jgi:hypothetical protein